MAPTVASERSLIGGPGWPASPPEPRGPSRKSSYGGVRRSACGGLRGQPGGKLGGCRREALLPGVLVLVVREVSSGVLWVPETLECLVVGIAGG